MKLQSIIVVLCMMMTLSDAQKTKNKNTEKNLDIGGYFMSLFPNALKVDILSKETKYYVVICYLQHTEVTDADFARDNFPPIAWYDKDGNKVGNDSKNENLGIYQINSIPGYKYYPASLAISRRAKSAVLGNYICSSEKIDVDTSVEVTMESISPEVDLYPDVENITLTENGITTITCYDESTDSVSWYEGDVEISAQESSAVYQERDGAMSHLHITSKVAQSGEVCYACESDNKDHGGSRDVCVEEIPQGSEDDFPIQIQPNDTAHTFQKGGDNGTIKVYCNMTNSLDYELGWYKDDCKVTEDKKEEVYQVISNNAAILYISGELGFSHAGRYDCIAVQNGSGSMQSVLIEVEGDYDLSIYQNVAKYAFIENIYPVRDTEITCSSQDDILTSWYHDSTEVGRIERNIYQYGTVYSSNLRIERSATYDDSGIYSCQRQGFEEKKIEVTVQIFTQGLLPMELIQSTGEFYINISYRLPVERSMKRSISEPSIAWYRDGGMVEADTKLSIHQIQQNFNEYILASLIIYNQTIHSGSYACIAVEDDNADIRYLDQDRDTDQGSATDPDGLSGGAIAAIVIIIILLFVIIFILLWKEKKKKIAAVSPLGSSVSLASSQTSGATLPGSTSPGPSHLGDTHSARSPSPAPSQTTVGHVIQGDVMETSRPSSGLTPLEGAAALRSVSRISVTNDAWEIKNEEITA